MTLCVNYILLSLCMDKGVCAGITSVCTCMDVNCIYTHT